MNNALTNIVKQLDEVFKDLDERLVKESVEWVMKHYHAYMDYMNSDENADRSLSYDERSKREIYIAGGATYRNMFNHHSEDEIKKRATKKAKSVIQSRNTAIANKLIKAEITEVLDSHFTSTHDGFDGIFKVETNKGPKKVTISTIYAGGYHIQCFHLRVLVKVR